ncbi:hypothetical protein BJ875DRAFT_516798, partial [Amylocarpus encephaloides]
RLSCHSTIFVNPRETINVLELLVSSQKSTKKIFGSIINTMSKDLDEYGGELAIEIFQVEIPPRETQQKRKTRKVAVFVDKIDRVYTPQEMVSPGGAVVHGHRQLQPDPNQVMYTIPTWTSINPTTRKGDGSACDSPSPTLEGSSSPTTEESLRAKRTSKVAISTSNKISARSKSHPPPSKRHQTASSSPSNQSSVVPENPRARPVGRRSPWSELEQAIFMCEYWTAASWKKMSDAMNAVVLTNRLEGPRVFNSNMVYKQSHDHIRYWLLNWGCGFKAENFVKMEIALRAPALVGDGASSSSSDQEMSSGSMDGVEYGASSSSSSPLSAGQVDQPQPIREQISETRFAITTVMGARHEFEFGEN